jgi:DHA1 family bicyclomycin/chloramphenicol resistance-like MFS transporter
MRIKPNSISFTLLLGLLAALPPLSIDMGLPAFAKIATSLSASPASVGLTLSLFMLGYAVAQLAFGPFSDRYGRKPVLLIGCLLFALASAACTIAPSIDVLLTWRFFEGAGAGAGMTLMLAMVRDLFEGATARAQLSYVNLVITVAPMIAPTIGGGVVAIASWRFIYGLLSVGGFVLVLTIAFGLGESIKSLDVNALQPRRLIENYLRVITNRVCLGYALVNALSFGCMFAYVAGSPLVMLKVLGVSTTTYGLLFASTAIGIMVGSFLNGRLNTHGVSSARLLYVGLMLAATSAVALVLVTVTGAAQVTTLMPLLILNTFCYGLVAPNAMHNAIQPVPEIAGIAAAVVGFLRMLGGALASALIGFLFDGHTANAMSEVMALFAISALAIYASITKLN